MKSVEAVAGASFCTRAERMKTSASSAMMRPKKSIGVETIVCRRAGELATEKALAAMNDEYERRFGFRFVVFVAGRSKSGIVPVFRERLQRTRAQELATGIDEFLAISRDRLERAAT